jgi:acetolactate synthase-1/2/3 large subunit
VLISGAENELVQFAEKTGIPVALTLLGLSAFPTGHRLYAGFIGMHGNYAPNILTNEADLIIAIGMRFDDRVTGNLKKYAKNARIIHIEIDEAEINKNVTVDLEINNDAREVLNHLIPLVNEKNHENGSGNSGSWTGRRRKRLLNLQTMPGTGQIIEGEVIISLFSELTMGDAIAVTDVVRTRCRWHGTLNLPGPNTLSTSGGMEQWDSVFRQPLEQK